MPRMRAYLVMVILPACALILCPQAVHAVDLGHDESGHVKISLSSLPFFDDPADDADRSSSYDDDYDPDDEEYTTDSLGRRVPVRTRKGGTAIHGM